MILGEDIIATKCKSETVSTKTLFLSVCIFLFRREQMLATTLQTAMMTHKRIPDRTEPGSYGENPDYQWIRRDFLPVFSAWCRNPLAYRKERNVLQTASVKHQLRRLKQKTDKDWQKCVTLHPSTAVYDVYDLWFCSLVTQSTLVCLNHWQQIFNYSLLPRVCAVRIIRPFGQALYPADMPWINSSCYCLCI